MRVRLAMLVLAPGCAAHAGVWGADPNVGVTGDYASNPGLLNTPHPAQSDTAVILDSPLSYVADDMKFSVLPSARFGNTRSYASTTSDYEHLTARSEFDTERGALTGSAGLTRDSSLYQDYLSNGAVGVRRDGRNADLSWDRMLRERLDALLDVATTTVRYAQTAGVGSLVNYRYDNLATGLTWIASERGKLSVNAVYGRYDSLDRTTSSRTQNLQLGYLDQLSPLWSVTASAGYSRARNRLDEEILLRINTGKGVLNLLTPYRVESSQNSPVYSLSIARQGALSTLTASATRQETPNGLAYLTLQDTLEFKAYYALTPRWSLSGDVRYIRTQNQQATGAAAVQSSYYKNLTLNASWQWTERWTAALTASRVAVLFEPSRLGLASNQIAVTLTRKFDHLHF